MTETSIDIINTRSDEVDPATLTLHPLNPRQGDVGLLTTLYQENGFYGRVVVDGRTGYVLAGNHRVKAALALGMPLVPVEYVTTRDDDHATAIMLADNRASDLATNDEALLAELLEGLARDGGLQGSGYDGDDLDELLASINGRQVEAPEPKIDEAEALREKWGVERGQLWQIGRHRLLCGDATNADDVARLMDGQKAELLHADPPYGMGKEKDGIVNDNLHREKLDAFQMKWWRAIRPHLTDNASAYIWGNAEELWRLWYVGGLKDSERLTIRNEIVWNKGESGAAGVSLQGSADLRKYPPGSERCLFFMLGEQGFNNNADNYWEGWEPIRALLMADCEKMEWDAKDIERICGVGMFSHWFTKSQWCFIPEEHYRKLQAAACDHDAFKRDHDAFKRDHDAFKRDHDKLKREFYATRAHFNNTHDNMTDVWSFSRVMGDERHGHATPKPVDMIGRCIKSSTSVDGKVLEPFLGSGSTICAAELERRTCYALDIDPGCAAITLERLSAMGLEPVLAE